MKISELFFSLQGEGTYIGVPSIFIRTSGCNLKCYFCDTPYTSWWHESKSLEVEDIVTSVENTWGRVNHVVITGGEPMMQPAMAKLVKLLKENNHFITIETNGTIFKEDVRPDLFSISPKTSNSVPDEKNCPNGVKFKEKFKTLHLKNNSLKNLYKYVNCGTDYQVKFVVAKREDLVEVCKIVEEYNIPKEHVYLMPEGITKEDLTEKYQWVAGICKEHNFTFCPRLHIEIWGNQRGI